jgi:hypothetical protein
MAMAPGKHQMKKTKMAGMIPAWISAILKSIFVLAGPGSACERANISWYWVFVSAIYTMFAEVAYEYYSHIQALSLGVMEMCIFEAFLTLVLSLISKTIPVFFVELILCRSASPLPTICLRLYLTALCTPWSTFCPTPNVSPRFTFSEQTDNLTKETLKLTVCSSIH